MNPHKIKTIRRTFAAVPGAVWRAITELGRNAVAAFAWLQSHVDGYRVDVEALARALGVSPRTAYRAVAVLESADVLKRDDAIWTLQIPSDMGVTPRAVASERAGIPTEKKQTTKETYRHERVGSAPTASVSVSRGSRMEPPSNCPDPNGRTEVPERDRLPSLPKFVEAWRYEFPKSGPCAGLIPGAAWQQRLLWIRRHWTHEELREAFKLTRDAAPSNPWRYFIAILSKTAAGTLNDRAASGLKSRNTFEPDEADDWTAGMMTFEGGE